MSMRMLLKNENFFMWMSYGECIVFKVRENSKSNEGRQEMNGGVKGRYGSAEELDRETGEEQTTVGMTRRKDGG